MKKITNLKETVFTHISGSDGLPLSVLRIEPEFAEDIRGIVVIVHGKNEHKFRYAAFMRYLAAHGYLTIANDHRGHGESVLSPDDRGYFYKDMRHDILHERNKIRVYADILRFIEQ